MLQAFRREKVEDNKLKMIYSLYGEGNAAVAKQILLRELKESKKEDTFRVFLLYALPIVMPENQADSSLLVAQQGLTISERLKFTRGEANGLRVLGNLFRLTGNYPRAIELNLAALKKTEEWGDEKRTGYVYKGLGSLYAYIGDYSRSTAYTLKAKAIAEKLKDTTDIINSLINLGDDYEKRNRLDSAKYYIQLANQLSMDHGDEDLEQYTLGNFGNIYAKLGQPDIALGYYRSAMPYFVETQNWSGVSELALGMVKVFDTKGMTDSVKHYSAVAMSAAKNSGISDDLLAVSSFLAGYYKKKGIADSAYVYLNATIEAKDSLFSEEKNRQIQSMGFEESIRQEKIAAQQKEQELERQTNLQYAIIAIGVICFAVIFLLLSRTVIVNEKWIRFLGILGLLLLFEFINLLLHPFIGDITHHSPVLMLAFMVVIASLLIPVHHRLEHWITTKMTAKNKAIRLEAARKTVAKLEAEVEEKKGH
ncbi:MAG: hypothetical protein DI535_23490 [Citrobacter freundii]|nr:MAG: hypothetical protein DI535_23490 [Citrobacter freundii]